MGLRYVVRRIVLLIPVLFGVSLVSFCVLRFVPGDPARILAGEEASEDQVAQIRREYGLDRPVVVQYVLFIGRLAHGDLGTSYRDHAPVTQLLRDKFIFTLRLAVTSIILAAVFGIGIGMFAATHCGSALDRLSMVVAVSGLSTPVFWLGLILILVFGVWFHILPSGGSGSWRHMILPSIALGAGAAAIMARITRGVMVEVLDQDYVRVARAKGLHERAVVFGHALRNALLPLLTVFGLQFGTMLSGAVLTESVFSLPGLGRLMVDSIFARNYPVVQGGILLIATTFVIVNLFTDLLYGVLDPRIRRS